MGFRWAADQKTRSGAAAEIKQWARELLGDDDDLALTVAELDCEANFCCGGRETVIGLLWPSRTERVRIPAPMAQIHRFEVMCALWAAGFHIDFPEPYASLFRAPL